MSADRFQRVASLFEALRELTPPERAARLDADCAGDVALRVEVDELLRHHDADTALLAEDAPKEPEVVGGYRLLERIGVGGMGTVHRAEPLAGGSPVAVKLLHRHLLESARYRERFLLEARLGASVVHPGVVRVLGTGDDPPHIVMEFVEGQSLRALSDELGRVPEELCRQIALDVTSALEAIHAVGAVHRDVKPENVMVTADHVVKLADLGVARMADATRALSQTGAFVGSLEYAAPEQFGDQVELDGRVDLHALGIVLYEMSSGCNPFQADGIAAVVRKVLSAVPRRLGELNPRVSPFFEAVVHRLLEKARDDRFASAAALRAVLEAGADGEWWTEHRSRSKERHATRRPRTPDRTGLYGREEERAALSEAFSAAERGDGAVVVIQGEPGIGKSRLVDDLVVRLERAGADFDLLFGGYPPTGGAIGTGAVISALREHLGSAVEQRLTSLLPDAGWLVRSLAAVVRGLPPSADGTPLTPDALAAAVVGTVRALSGARPVVLVVEDLQFAPEEGRRLFQALALGARRHRICLIGTLRPGLPLGWVSGIERLPHARRIPLSRLGPRDLSALLVEAFGSERLAEELGWRLARTSDGNPFFVLEIIRSLQESGRLQAGADGTWSSTGVIARIELPASVKDMIAARLDALADDDREMLEVAACCGYEFDPLLVAEAVGRDRIPVLRALGRIVSRHALVRPSGPRFEFDHHQVQESLYEQLSPALRREYHDVLGDALEGRVSRDDVRGATATELARHFLAAGRGARAAPYVGAALDHLAPRSGDEAARLARRALDAPGALADRDRLAALRRLAAFHEQLGRRGERDEALEEALALAVELADTDAQIDLAAQQGWSLVMRGRAADAVRLLEEARARAREHGARRLEGVIEGHLGAATGYLGDQDACVAHHRAALAIAQEIGDRKLEGKACGGLGVTHWVVGDFEQSMKWDMRAYEIAKEIDDLRYQAVALGNVAGSYTAAGMYARSMELNRERLALSREIGYRRGEAIGLGNLALALVVMAQFDEACEMHARQIALCEDVGYRRGICGAYASIATTRAFQRRYEEVEEAALRAIEIARETGAKDLEASGELALGDCLRVQGRQDEAREHLTRAHELGTAAKLAAESAISLLLLAESGDSADGARTAYERHKGRMTWRVRMHAEHLMYRVTGDRAHLDEAWRRLVHLRDHAPPEYRGALVRDQPMHRAIADDHGAVG